MPDKKSKKTLDKASETAADKSPETAQEKKSEKKPEPSLPSRIIAHGLIGWAVGAGGNALSVHTDLPNPDVIADAAGETASHSFADKLAEKIDDVGRAIKDAVWDEDATPYVPDPDDNEYHDPVPPWWMG